MTETVIIIRVTDIFGFDVDARIYIYIYIRFSK